MRHTLLSAIATILVLLAVPGYSADTAPSPADIEKAVRDLGAVAYCTRERASQFLWSAGPAAEAALRMALSSDDPEVKFRATTILGKFSDGIFSDTPTHVLATITQYKAGNRGVAINRLIDAGLPGLRSLVVLWKSAPDENTRRTIGTQVEEKARALLVPTLLTQGQFDFADALLEFGATTQTEGQYWCITSHAAWLLLHDRLKPRIAELRADPAPTPTMLRQLAYLYRADGDLTNALACAVRLSDTHLTRNIRRELGDWNELAADPGGWLGIDMLGLQAAYHRLAGNKSAFDAALTNIHAFAERDPKREAAWRIATTFLINARVQDAINYLTRAKRYNLVYGILMPTGQTEAALRVVARARQEKIAELPYLEWKVAGDLNALGATNEARTIITGLLSNSLATADSGTAELIGTAQEKGLISEAATLAATALRKFSPDQAEDRQRILGSLFPESAARADAWLSLLRETATPGTLEEHLARLHGYFTAKPASLREFIALAEKSAPAFQKLTPGEQSHLWQSLADAQACLGQISLMVACERRACEASNGAPNYMRLATALFKASEWRNAADAARRANELQPTPASLWAHGWALAKAGDDKVGHEAMDRADLLALADEDARFALVEIMEQCGANEMALRQQDLIMRLGTFDSDPIRKCTDRWAARAYNAGDFATSILMRDRHFLLFFYGGRYFPDISRYLGYAYWNSRAATFLSLDQGHVEEAVEHARLAQKTWPCDTGLPIHVGLALEKAGRKDAADELFTNAFDCVSATVRRFPGYAGGHNQLAWLCARTRRSLPAGLENARQAVDLAPANTGYRNVNVPRTASTA